MKINNIVIEQLNDIQRRSTANNHLPLSSGVSFSFIRTANKEFGLVQKLHIE